MNTLVIKYFITASLIVLISEIAKKMDRLGAFISALPLITLTVMIWMYIENVPREKIANHALFTFWYVLPTLPMFLLMPWLLNRGVNFWLSLAACTLMTFISFIVTSFVAKYFGVELIS